VDSAHIVGSNLNDTFYDYRFYYNQHGKLSLFNSKNNFTVSCQYDSFLNLIELKSNELLDTKNHKYKNSYDSTILNTITDESGKLIKYVYVKDTIKIYSNIDTTILLLESPRWYVAENMLFYYLQNNEKINMVYIYKDNKLIRSLKEDIKH